MNGLRLYLRYAGVSVRSQLQYRASVILQSIGAFVLVQRHIRIPRAGRVYSINEAYRDHFPRGYQEYLDWAHGAGYSSRYIGSMAYDPVQRVTVLQGGTEPGLLQNRREDAVRDVTELGEHVHRPVQRLGEQCPGLVEMALLTGQHGALEEDRREYLGWKGVALLDQHGKPVSSRVEMTTSLPEERERRDQPRRGQGLTRLDRPAEHALQVVVIELQASQPDPLVRTGELPVRPLRELQEPGPMSLDDRG